MTADEWEPRVDDLYGLPAAEFVAARETLARELRQSGRKDDAAAVHALRRPTVVAWCVNQVARTHAAQVAALVAAGAEVEDAQRQATEGTRSDLRAASRERRAVLDELTDAAAALADNPAAQRAAIEATLDGASLDPQLQPVLVAGRLTKELAPVARFEFGDLDVTPARTTAPAPTRARKPPRDDLAVRRARQALEQARARADDATAQNREAGEAAAQAEQEVEDATRSVADLQAALGRARAELLDARHRAAEARRAETAARTAERRAAASLRSAEAAVDARA